MLYIYTVYRMLVVAFVDDLEQFSCSFNNNAGFDLDWGGNFWITGQRELCRRANVSEWLCM